MSVKRGWSGGAWSLLIACFVFQLRGSTTNLTVGAFRHHVTLSSSFQRLTAASFHSHPSRASLVAPLSSKQPQIYSLEQLIVQRPKATPQPRLKAPRVKSAPGDGARALALLVHQATQQMSAGVLSKNQSRGPKETSISARDASTQSGPTTQPLLLVSSWQQIARDRERSLRLAVLGCVKEEAFWCVVEALRLASAMVTWEQAQWQEEECKQDDQQEEEEEEEALPSTLSSWHVSFNTFKVGHMS